MDPQFNGIVVRLMRYLARKQKRLTSQQEKIIGRCIVTCFKRNNSGSLEVLNLL